MKYITAPTEDPSPLIGVSRQKYKRKITAHYPMGMGMAAARFITG